MQVDLRQTCIILLSNETFKWMSLKIHPKWVITTEVALTLYY